MTLQACDYIAAVIVLQRDANNVWETNILLQRRTINMRLGIVEVVIYKLLMETMAEYTEYTLKLLQQSLQGRLQRQDKQKTTEVITNKPRFYQYVGVDSTATDSLNPVIIYFMLI